MGRAFPMWRRGSVVRRLLVLLLLLGTVVVVCAARLEEQKKSADATAAHEGLTASTHAATEGRALSRLIAKERDGHLKKESKDAEDLSRVPRQSSTPSLTKPHPSAQRGEDIPDCLALVGPRTRTLGGHDQPPLPRPSQQHIRGGKTPADGLVRDFTQRVQLTCRFFYHMRDASQQPAQQQRPTSPEGVTSAPADEEMGGTSAAHEAPLRLPFPRRYKAMDKQQDLSPTNPQGQRVPGSGATRVSYFDVLLGLPDPAQASPLRRHAHLFYAQVAKSEADERAEQQARGAQQPQKNEEAPQPFTADGPRGRLVQRQQLVHVKRVLDNVKETLRVHLTHAWHALSRYPFHSPAAVKRFFAVRTLRISFPLWERRRRAYTDRHAGEKGDGDDDDDDVRRVEEEVEELLAEELLSSPASRAALLSDGSLGKLRVVSFPPTPRSSAVEAVKDRLVCDFKAVLEAAAYVREVEQDMQRQHEEEERRRRLRMGLDAAAEEEDEEDADMGEHDDSVDDGEDRLLDDNDDEEAGEAGRRWMGLRASRGGTKDTRDVDETAEEKALKRLMRRRTRGAKAGQAKTTKRHMSTGSGSGGARATRSVMSMLLPAAANTVPTRSSGRRDDNRRGGVLSYFPLFAWGYHRVVGLLLPAAAGATPRFSSSSSSTSSSLWPSEKPPLSYTLAKAYVAQVTEELGPFQPSRISFSSDYIRYLLGRRALHTSKRLVHVEEAMEEEKDGGGGGEKSGTGLADHTRTASHLHKPRKANTRARVIRERELFVWKASLASTETMCIGLVALPALPPPPAAAAGARVEVGRRGARETAASPAVLRLSLHEELVFDMFWLKLFLGVLISHVYLRKHVENSRVFTFVFASLCGLFVLLFAVVFYVVREIQKMSVGRMGVYFLLFFGGLTAFAEAVVSVATLAIQQLLDTLDAQDGGVDILSLFSLSFFPSSRRHSGGSGVDADGFPGEDDDLHDSQQQHALTLLVSVAAVLLGVGVLSSIMVRCFVPDRYLRVGTRWSVKTLLALAWLLVVAVNREATALALLLYVLVLGRPRLLIAAIRRVVSGRHRGGARRAGGDRAVSGAACSKEWADGRRSFGETSYEPTDAIPDEARRYHRHVTPLVYESHSFFPSSSVSRRSGDVDDHDDENGNINEGTRRGFRGRAAPLSHAEKMRKYESDGAAHTRQALEALAQTLRANPALYAGRLRDPNGVQRWAGEASEDENAEEDDDDDM